MKPLAGVGEYVERGELPAGWQMPTQHQLLVNYGYGSLTAVVASFKTSAAAALGVWDVMSAADQHEQHNSTHRLAP